MGKLEKGREVAFYAWLKPCQQACYYSLCRDLFACILE